MKIGDSIDYLGAQRRIIEILPYNGIYKEWFNCVLVIESNLTRTGKKEIAYLDKNQNLS